VLCYFSFHRTALLRPPHSFPTRRSSDLLSFLSSATGKLLHERHFDGRRMDGLSQGLRSHFRRRMTGVPAVLRRLRGAREQYDTRSEEHTSELQSRENIVCRLLLEKKKKK